LTRRAAHLPLASARLVAKQLVLGYFGSSSASRFSIARRNKNRKTQKHKTWQKHRKTFQIGKVVFVGGKKKLFMKK